LGTKLGFSDRKTVAPQNMPELILFLSTLLSATVNNEVDVDTAKTASNIADRMIQALQADTRMKVAAIATQRTLTNGSGFSMLELEKKVASK